MANRSQLEMTMDLAGVQYHTPAPVGIRVDRGASTVSRSRLEIAMDLFARAIVCTLFLFLSVRLFTDFLHTGRLTGLLLMASESLVVILTLIRRPARVVDRSLAAAVTTTIPMLSVQFLRTTAPAALMPDIASATISAAGLLIVVVGKIFLGRSFGLVPANRGVVAKGPYGFVRHPIYTGYLISHIGFLFAYPSLWNIVAMTVGDSVLIVRALVEERVLKQDAQYQAYCERVAWHLIPGVF